MPDQPLWRNSTFSLIFAALAWAAGAAWCAKAFTGMLWNGVTVSQGQIPAALHLPCVAATLGGVLLLAYGIHLLHLD